jgi:hypothetical protein
MEKCSNCGTIAGSNQKAMWSKVATYRWDYKLKRPIPVFSQHQGHLCEKCMKSLSAYPVERFSDLKQSKKKKEKPDSLSLWDAFR